MNQIDARDESIAKRTVPLVVLSALTILSKLPTLTTPAYWDETGWFRQAEWLAGGSLIRAIPGFRDPSAFFGHPPGLHVVFAVVAKIFGTTSLPLAHLLIAVFSAIGVCATFLLGRHLYGSAAGWAAALLLLVCPAYFAQSGMFLSDLPVAALGTLSIYFALSGRFRSYLICAACMTLLKETAAAIPVAIAVCFFFEARRAGKTGFREVARYVSPLAAIGAFVVIQWITTRHFVWIYSFNVQLFRYDLISPLRGLGEVVLWIFWQQGRFVFTALIALSIALSPAARRRKELLLFLFMPIFAALPFAIIYYLPRYVLPVLPLLFVLAVGALHDIVRNPTIRLACMAALVCVFSIMLFTQPLWGTGETSLRYRDAVAVSKSATAMISRDYPSALVAAAFPNDLGFADPLLGYVDRPHAVKSFDVGSDITGASVILVSSPASTAGDSLRVIATTGRWRQAARFESAGAWAEIYVKR